ncbi:uncharacterized protein LOC123534390 [Mercenaria mercenaria]|uniref:uncharacterized protein LOC123534390 n=1 Tax=Mercenaria mercenaria TaxID=6596 RepID=UPI00234F382F|nr:uncharacterized protein LOC123534390 [Mercenaria mercenaria]
MKVKIIVNRLALFCFFQAFVVILTIMYVLVYVPDLVLVEDSKQLNSEEEMVILERESEQKRQDILKERRALSKGVSRQLSGGQTCVLFRFDALPGQEQTSSVAMINDGDEYAYLSKEGEYMPQNIPEWFHTKTDYCNGCFVTYGLSKCLISLKEVTIYPKFGHGKPGGEELEDVFMQTEEEEVFKLDKGYFVLNSNELDLSGVQFNTVLQKFTNGLLIMKETDINVLNAHKKQDRIAVITARREYANFYHTTMDWYDIFLIMVLFKIDLYHLEVIWLDAHPKSNFDPAWEILFGVPIRVGSLSDPVKYEQMIWNGFGHKSHINQHQIEYLPFVNEFRHFVLNRFQINDDHEVNCNELRITIIWRRHYIAHPRNPSGYTSRRIANEEEVWRSVKEADFQAVVNGVQLDRLSMVEQLELVSRTDILIGMHGAGLSHILYLPETSGVIELYPNYMSVANAHFRAMSKWRRLRHIVWMNQDNSLEKKDHQTYIPKTVIQDLVDTIKENICEKRIEL